MTVQDIYENFRLFAFAIQFLEATHYVNLSLHE
jgi:hypothetical protein